MPRQEQHFGSVAPAAPPVSSRLDVAPREVRLTGAREAAKCAVRLRGVVASVPIRGEERKVMGCRRNPPKGQPGHQHRDPFTYSVLWALTFAAIAGVVWLAFTR